jgi:hypothetical protein
LLQLLDCRLCVLTFVFERGNNSVLIIDTIPGDNTVPLGLGNKIKERGAVQVLASHVAAFSAPSSDRWRRPHPDQSGSGAFWFAKVQASKQHAKGANDLLALSSKL